MRPEERTSEYQVTSYKTETKTVIVEPEREVQEVVDAVYEEVEEKVTNKTARPEEEAWARRVR